jgi:hypothetical protein
LADSAVRTRYLIAPIFTAIFAAVMPHERIPPIAIGGIRIGFIGTTLVHRAVPAW